MRRSLLLVLASLLLGGPSSLVAQEEPIVIYLVRHAERIDDEAGFDASATNDPVISTAGADRAQLLADIMEGAALTRIHSTDLNRTRMTGQPTAEKTGLAIESYDPRDLTEFAARLRGTPGRHLVVGHSNTTPNLVAALGGAPGRPIEAMEYDRLYVVVLLGGSASTRMIRFGTLFGS